MISPNISKNILLILIRLLETKLIIREYVLFNDSYMKNASNLLFHVHLWEPELHALLMVKQVVGKLIQWMEISKMDALEFIILGLKIYLCSKIQRTLNFRYLYLSSKFTVENCLIYSIIDSLFRHVRMVSKMSILLVSLSNQL